ncbi:MAG: MotA/TolQ/ExbB proton channel family protein [Paracoccaceae bacterium]|nr:MotA/TolQ/ExbB proton channel family protein [Paracoccaceae bacterium]
MTLGLFETTTGLATRGGPVVLLLIAMSVVGMSVIVYKLWQFRVAGVGRHHFLRQAVEAWDTGSSDAASRHMRDASSYLKPVIALGMEEAIDAERLEAEAEERFSRLEAGFRLLDSVAQLAPLLGLFGTVLGMISAFQALQEAGNQVDPAALAGGIWVALLTTAVGLAVAMPTTLMLNWFESRIDADRVFAGKAIRTLKTPLEAASRSVSATASPTSEGEPGLA